MIPHGIAISEEFSCDDNACNVQIRLCTIGAISLSSISLWHCPRTVADTV